MNVTWRRESDFFISICHPMIYHFRKVLITVRKNIYFTYRWTWENSPRVIFLISRKWTFKGRLPKRRNKTRVFISLRWEIIASAFKIVLLWCSFCFRIFGCEVLMFRRHIKQHDINFFCESEKDFFHEKKFRLSSTHESECEEKKLKTAMKSDHWLAPNKCNIFFCLWCEHNFIQINLHAYAPSIKKIHS